MRKQLFTLPKNIQPLAISGLNSSEINIQDKVTNWNSLNLYLTNLNVVMLVKTSFGATKIDKPIYKSGPRRLF